MKKKRINLKGIKKFRPIIRNRDEKGRILTYTVFTESGAKMEFNTLKKAKIMAAIIE